MDAGIDTSPGLALAIETATPPSGAGPFSSTRADVAAPPPTALAARTTRASEGGVSGNDTERETPDPERVNVTSTGVATGLVWIGKTA